jgi:hypothetical protein
VEQQLFAGAGAEVFLTRSRGIKILKYVTKTQNFSILKFEVDFKNHNFVAIYLKEPFLIIYVFKKT